MNETTIVCPITKQIFCDPVVADDGNVYEKDALFEWLKTNKSSPMTREPITDRVLPVILLRNMIEDFIVNNPELKQRQYIPVREFKKYKEEVYGFIKNNQFNELLNYHYYNYTDLIKLKIKINLNDKDKEVNSIYYIFKFCNDEKILMHLVDEMNYSTNETYKELHYCISLFCNEQFVLDCIKKHPTYFSLTHYTSHKYNSLHMFAIRGFIGAINLLFEKYPDFNVNALTKKNYTALMFAIRHRHYDIVKLLVDKKTDMSIHVKNYNYIIYAVMQQTPFEIIKYMLENGTNVKGNTYMLKLFLMIFKFCKDSYKKEFIKYLLDHQIELNLKLSTTRSTIDKNNILHYACQKSSNEIIKLIVDKTDLLNSQNKLGYAPLMLALKHKKFGALKYMLSKNPDITLKSTNGSELIHWFGENANCDIMTHVLNNYEFNLNSKNTLGMQPIHFALQENSPKISEILINKGIELDCVAFKDLLKKNSKYPHLIKLFLSKFNDFNGEWKSNRPIHVVIKYNNNEITKILIDKGVDLEVQNKEKSKPIHLLCANNKDNKNEELIRYLIDVKNVDIESINELGYRPLHYVCLTGTIELIKHVLAKTKDHSTNIKHDISKEKKSTTVKFGSPDKKDEVVNIKYNNIYQLLMQNPNVETKVKSFFSLE